MSFYEHFRSTNLTFSTLTSMSLSVIKFKKTTIDNAIKLKIEYITADSTIIF